MIFFSYCCSNSFHSTLVPSIKGDSTISLKFIFTKMVEARIPETSTPCTFPKIVPWAFYYQEMSRRAFFTIGRRAQLYECFEELSTSAFSEREIKFWWRWISLKWVYDPLKLWWCHDRCSSPPKPKSNGFLIQSRTLLAFDRHSSGFLATLGPILKIQWPQ